MNSKEQKKEKSRNMRYIVSFLFMAAVIFGVVFFGNYYNLLNILPSNIEKAGYQNVSPDLFAESEKSRIDEKISEQKSDISELNERIDRLESAVDNFNLKDEMSILAISFSKIRYLAENDLDYKSELAKFTALAAKDNYLMTKAEELSGLLGQKNYDLYKIEDEFNNKIDDLVILRNKYANKEKDGFLNGLRQYIKNLIIARRIDGKINNQEDEIDYKILQIQRFLRFNSFESALNLIDSLDPYYKEHLVLLRSMIKSQIEIEKSFQEIFLYLNKLVNNV